MDMKKNYMQPQIIVCEVAPVQPICINGSPTEGDKNTLTHSRGDAYDDGEESRLW